MLRNVISPTIRCGSTRSNSQKIQILSLYKQCLRTTREVKYSDPDWLFNRIKLDFQKGKFAQDETEIINLIEKAEYYLSTRTII